MLQYPMNTLKLKKALRTSVFTHEEIAYLLPIGSILPLFEYTLLLWVDS